MDGPATGIGDLWPRLTRAGGVDSSPRWEPDRPLSVVLARGVRWDIDLDGGASRESVDMHWAACRACASGPACPAPT
jgi:hypothetical protein